jgi:ABC-type multidrug transport system fused ATPase/permease subunit
MALNPVSIVVMAIILLISLIYSAIAVINKFTGANISATGVIVGALTSAVAFVWNLFLGLVDMVLGLLNYLVNPFIAFANFFGNLFRDPIGAIIRLFGDMADNVLGIIESIAKAIDKVFGSSLADTVSGWRTGLDAKIEAFANEHGNGKYEQVMEELNLDSSTFGAERWAYGDAWDYGYELGEGLGDKVSDMFGGDALDYTYEDLMSKVGDIDDNTSAISDSMDITSEDLKYLKDLAERDTINRFTTAEIRIEQTNNNNINSEMDIDGVVDKLTEGVNEAMEKVAEGVH